MAAIKVCEYIFREHRIARVELKLPPAFFLVSTKGVIVVDCPPTIGHKILYAIGNITSIPITHLVYSHSHADHISGVWIFGKDVKTIAHVDTALHLSLTPDPTRPPPKITFK